MELDSVFIKIQLIKGVGLCLWFYLCVVLVKHFSGHIFMKNSFQPIINAVSLVLGPLSLFAAFSVQFARRASKKNLSLWDALCKLIKGTFWGKGLDAELSDESLIAADDIDILDNTGKSIEAVYGNNTSRSDTAVALLSKQIIADAIQSAASDVLLDPSGTEGYTVRLRVDGKLRLSREMNTEVGAAVINCIKAVSGMDISEKRKPLDGAFTAKVKGESASFRVATAGVVNGQKMSIRLLSLFTGRLELEEVGFKEKDLVRVKNALSKSSGMILLCGPTGSGKTTTMYGMLSAIDRVERNVITIEDPVEHSLKGASQIEINPKAGINFGDTLKGILRQDPDVIGIGEIRDPLTAQTAVQASHTGHLIIASMHSSDNLTAIMRLKELGVETGLLASNISLIISQRLVRNLCDDCKEPGKLSSEKLQVLQKRHIDTEHIMSPVGCEKCSFTGYKGRTALFDVLEMDDETKNQIADLAEVTRENLIAASSGRMKSKMKKEALKKVISGETSFQEVKSYL
ncbi:GspE/PulE family protein [Sedimentisphaera salicampi]|uniref:Type II traffic warden ATPase n=1 Tax=Sedimentisphaera salicampi TaxID=1941349 RepID=A0A1W6LK80_9BACT|nr:GspE/PulE family protein [Sedimentisphaera salicampi]ARN56198.1 Type II traffic warden ATPase [Sedimentisphaera salicampi]